MKHVVSVATHLYVFDQLNLHNSQHRLCRHMISISRILGVLRTVPLHEFDIRRHALLCKWAVPIGCF